ncbi:MAG: DEAD/DEAH box helicase [Candidatus Saccharimonadales bacterium]
MSYAYKMSRSSSVAGRYKRSGTGQRRTPNQSRGKRRGQYIDPARFVKTAAIGTIEAYAPHHAFTDFALNKTLQDNLAHKGFVTPTAIQDQAIPHALEGRDVIGIASTGTGKTAAFALPMLHKLMAGPHSSALVVAPTRELAQQIEMECKALGRNSGLSAALLIGGTNMNGQLRDLKQRPRIVIGTPGRIKDHLQRGSLSLKNFNVTVLDEVDRMLDMGFINDVTEILNQASQERQSLFFSATLDTRVRNLIHGFSQDPVVISIAASTTSENVHQDVVRYNGNAERLEKLHDILLKEDVAKVILFDETQRSVERLSNELLARGFKTDAIHGGKTQGQRLRALNKFKKNEIKILVATDVAARGIDVADITHVINYSVPQMYDDYIHRIGRAGRAGKTGHALTFVSN